MSQAEVTMGAHSGLMEATGIFGSGQENGDVAVHYR